MVKKNSNINRNIFYLCVHKRLSEKYSRKKEVSNKDFYIMLREVYHIPKKLIIVVIKEMEELNMIEVDKSSRKKVINILPMITDPEVDANKFYEELGIF